MMRKTMSIPSRCLTTLVRKRPEVRGIGKIDVAALVELRLLRVAQKTGGERAVSSAVSLGTPGQMGWSMPWSRQMRLSVDAEMNIGGTVSCPTARY